jgi:hypothetical protein
MSATYAEAAVSKVAIKEWFHDGTTDYHLYDPNRGHGDYRLVCGLAPRLGHGGWADVGVIDRWTDMEKVKREVCPQCVAYLTLDWMGS